MHGTFPGSGEVRWTAPAVPLKKPGRIYHRPEELQSFVYKALWGGAVREGPHQLVWNVAGDCASPVWLEHISKGVRVPFPRQRMVPFDDGEVEPFDPIRDTASGRWVCPYLLHTVVPCRKCERCLKRRGRLWRDRIAEEIRMAVRSWFVTFTLNGPTRRLLTVRAAARAREAGVHWHDHVPEPGTGDESQGLTARERFAAVTNEMKRELTKYIKRLRAPRTVVRKGGEKVRLPGSKFRYSVVPEAHKDGTPHLHVTFHELVGGTLTKEQLKEEWGGSPWKLGFVNAVLVKEELAHRGAGYLTKYLCKDMPVRPNASLKYGRPFEALELRMGWKVKPRRPQPQPMAPVANEANDCWMTTDPDVMAELTRALRSLSVTPEGSSGSELAEPGDPMEREPVESHVVIAQCYETERIRHYRRRDVGRPPGGSVVLLN